MKRILLPAGGAILATGLLAAGLAGTANANAVPDWASDTMAKDVPAAQAVADFWFKANGHTNNLAKATPYTWETKATSKLKVSGGYTPDTKASTVAPIGEEKKTASKTKNINLPKTIGKVFFVDSAGDLKWCSGTSIQGKYKNLVATAGHCAYDDNKNASVMDKWVFVPGYYQGKTPWGIYVGKTAFTHYDYSVYNDRDRDYAFVTVYNGIQPGAGAATKVTFDDFKKYEGKKEIKKVSVSYEEFKKGKLDPQTSDFYGFERGERDRAAGPEFPGAEVTKKEVSSEVYRVARVGKGQGFKFGEPIVENVTERDAKRYNGPGKVDNDRRGNWTITHFYVQDWFKPGKAGSFYRVDFYVFKDVNKDLGALGNNVGGQGVAWNQKTGGKVFVFGYPADAHKDGHKAYTGVTPKWCYGATSGKTYASAAYKAEEHVALKCAMTPGADGSPWLVKYSNAKRLGYVNGVTSLFHDQDGNDRYDYSSSPYFDGETATVYNQAANTWSGSLAK
ncbi:trypsin-like serine peptidase [Nonomuraea glycinis]|uniref:trypsin-like serine peptidase n=1 Tax=Nonomuraea glycinis TaxID=2047744 RepID=UPI0033B97881